MTYSEVLRPDNSHAEELESLLGRLKRKMEHVSTENASVECFSVSRKLLPFSFKVTHKHHPNSHLSLLPPVLRFPVSLC